MRILANNTLYTARIKYINSFGNPVLIWNMGKVASTSIAQSLWKEIGRQNVLTTHFMNDPSRKRSTILFDELIKNSTREIPIITLTREPIGRNISSFFQNFKVNTGSSFSESKLTTNQLAEIFKYQFDKHNVTLNWFDNNFKKYLGFDVYEHQFNQETGYSIYTHENYRILVIRSEESDATKCQAVKELLHLDNFILKNTNVGDSKQYAVTYRNFKKELKLNANYVDRMLDSKYTTHFYTKTQIESVRNIWQ